MATEADPLSVSPAQIRQMVRDQHEMGAKLAQYEFRAMMRELADPTVFELEIDFPNPPAPSFRPTLMTNGPEIRRLPQLNVQLGAVAWHTNPQDLPTVGIFIPVAESDVLREALQSLITAHYTKPFARFVFLCESLRVVPILGRHQFTFEYLGTMPPSEAAMRLRYRFGIREILNLVTGNRLWSATSAETAADIEQVNKKAED